jgi:hypothetical protein
LHPVVLASRAEQNVPSGVYDKVKDQMVAKQK